MKCRRFRQLAFISAVAGLAGPVFGQAAADPSVADLQKQVQALTQRLTDLEQHDTAAWTSEMRTSQIRSIVEEVLADSKVRSQSAAGPTMGYNNGFFLESADRNFKLNVNGFIQARYTFAQDTVRHPAAFSTVPKSGNVNGFDFRRARVILTGNVFTPNLTYNFTGDFAGDYGAKNPVSTVKTDGSGNVTSTSTTSVPTDKNYLQIVDLFVAYRFNDMLNLRLGAFLTPFSRAEYMVSSAEFVDLPGVLSPFDPQRSMGLSVFGQPIKDRFSYELNMNNGQCSNALGRVNEISTSGGTASNAGAQDNRLAFYGRLQYAGAGTLADFTDEPDLRKDNSTLAWMVGGALGYESANTTSTAFPSPQGGVTTIPVGTLPSPGFTSYPLNGDLYRATLDATAKYEGLALTTAAYFQQINENPEMAGDTAVALPTGYGLTGAKANSSFFEMGYYGQAGYMLTPALELVGRVGEFMSEGSDNRMEEYALGVNYYLFRHNLKIQSDVTYIPNEALFTSSVIDSVVNTQDLIFRMQVQVKF